MTDTAAPVTIVLVHGACHGAWCWEKVIEPLESRGWTVRTVELPLTTLYADADVVRDAVAAAKAEGQRVLVAGHSYGGLVISEGGHDADFLVYLAASVPEPGASAGSMFHLIDTPELADAVKTSDDGMLWIDPVSGPAAFYNRCTPEQVEGALARIRPMHAQALADGVADPAWKHVPSSYVVCSDDRAMAPSYQRERAGWIGESIEIDTDHSLMYTAVDVLVDRLDELATRVATA